VGGRLAGRDAPLEDGDLATLLAEAGSGLRLLVSLDRFALVGRGPLADPELLTLKALRALQSPMLFCYGRPRGPSHCRDGTARSGKNPVGKRGYSLPCRQDHIVWQAGGAGIGKATRSSPQKGGDPMIFGRANEEIAALRAAGISG